MKKYIILDNLPYPVVVTGKLDILLILNLIILDWLGWLRLVDINIFILRVLPWWVLLVLNLQVFRWIILIIFKELIFFTILAFIIWITYCFRLNRSTIQIILQKLLIYSVLVALYILLLTRQLPSIISLLLNSDTASI